MARPIPKRIRNLRSDRGSSSIVTCNTQGVGQDGKHRSHQLNVFLSRRATFAKTGFRSHGWRNWVSKEVLLASTLPKPLCRTSARLSGAQSPRSRHPTFPVPGRRAHNIFWLP